MYTDPQSKCFFTFKSSIVAKYVMLRKDIIYFAKTIEKVTLVSTVPAMTNELERNTLLMP